MVVNNFHGLILITQSVSFSGPKVCKIIETILKKISCFLAFTTAENAIVIPKPTTKYYV